MYKIVQNYTKLYKIVRLNYGTGQKADTGQWVAVGVIRKFHTKKHTACSCHKTKQIFFSQVEKNLLVLCICFRVFALFFLMWRVLCRKCF